MTLKQELTCKSQEIPALCIFRSIVSSCCRLSQWHLAQRPWRLFGPMKKPEWQTRTATSVIGAGTLLPENKEIPDNSLVMGSPGKVVKTLTDAQVESLRKSAPAAAAAAAASLLAVVKTAEAKEVDYMLNQL